MGALIEKKPNRVPQVVLLGLILALFVLIVGIVLTASVPPVSRDALTHHLAIPKLFIKHGGIVELPDIPFSYYPMNLDLLYLAVLSFGNDIAPKYIHLFFALLTAGLTYHYLKPRMGSVFGMLGALLWLSTPIVVRLASEVYVDLGVAFFGFASIYMVLRWIDSGFKMRCLIWSGVWCGLALGTKYNALVILAILSLMVPYLRSRLDKGEKLLQQRLSEGTKSDQLTDAGIVSPRGSLRSVILATVCFVGVALIVFSPWMIRNTILKQNPIYPMFNRVFNTEDSSDPEWSRTATMVQDTSGTMVVRHLVFKESLGYMALMPLRIFYEGRDDSPRHFDGKLNPFLLVFSIAGFLPLGTLPATIKIEQRIWCGFSILFILIAFFTAPVRIRYILPALPAIVILAMIGIFRSWEYIRKNCAPSLQTLLKLLLSLAILLMLGYNANYFVDRFRKVEPLGYLNGEVTRDTYISERWPEYLLIKYINDNLAPDARILGLFVGQRMYYFDREIVFSEGILGESLRGKPSPDDVLSVLRSHGITHLVIRWDLFHNWTRQALDHDKRDALQKFWRQHIQEIMANNGYYLFVIKEY
ncbi:MAG: phospholipid carrier-dependent glycosyltransferase [Desulfobacteraceae bacterium]|nr:phospholipid carrier-dependent glycosyltransferase [Desulfobacteraceae bacterium]MBC2748996.1 glycosyltransferase family 39 protein [Desulfobacteraceae bacterium]